MASLKNIYCSQSRPSQGFILPLAMGTGLILLLIGTAMLLRSQTDEVTAIAQKSTTRSLAAAETGITRFQTLLGKYNAIAQYPACMKWSGNSCADSGADLSWANPNSLPALGVSVCGLPPGLGPDLQKAVTRDWQPIHNDPGRGQYRLVDYTYDESRKEGLLVVEGRVNQDVANVSATRLAVGIPMNVPSAKSSVPALWLRDSTKTKMGDEKFKGNIIINDCTLPTGSGQPTDKNLSDPNQFQLAATPDAFPKLPDLPPTSVLNIISDASLIWTQQLPRLGDIPDLGVPGDPSDDRYNYKVKELIGITSGQKLDIQQTDPNGKVGSPIKVDLYVQGNIILDDNVSINANGFSSQLRIFGNNQAQTYACAPYPAPCWTQSVQLKGTGVVKALIFAPDATGSIESGMEFPTTPTADEGYFKGSFWLKDWNSIWIPTKPIAADAMSSYADYGFNNFLVYPQRTTLSGIGSWNQQLVSSP